CAGPSLSPLGGERAGVRGLAHHLAATSRIVSAKACARGTIVSIRHHSSSRWALPPTAPVPAQGRGAERRGETAVGRAAGRLGRDLKTEIRCRAAIGIEQFPALLVLLERQKPALA